MIPFASKRTKVASALGSAPIPVRERSDERPDEGTETVTLYRVLKQ